MFIISRAGNTREISHSYGLVRKGSTYNAACIVMLRYGYGKNGTAIKN